ncbi:aldo/keto reductase [Christiangramia echinicola]|uniref:Predicted oxidoreductase n=1 Tax=Christiangramia echinicola TaxID=279359 RepID=A0A1H1KTM2_9FLAO|nr:aldo/keto reductase [Christiangramia echinicola]SDR65029.1 Predicted oxidoreductase [Christiangramia echinicola]
MEMKILGSSNLRTAPIIFGGNVFGWTANKNESYKLMDEMLDLGINMIDSADVYSRWASENKGGESERIIGEYLNDRKNREDLIIATKVGSSMQQGGDKDISEAHIIEAIEDSLNRLKTDYVDLYFTHWDDNKTPVEETLGAYEKLIKQGKVRYIGASNLSPERLQESLDAARTNNLPKYEVYQPEYSLAVRDKYEGKTQQICMDNNLGVTGYFSLASGFLTGKYQSKEDIKGTDREQFLKSYFDERGKKILKALKDISDHHNISQAAIALMWIMQRPGITAPIASASKPEHLQSFKEAMNMELSTEEMEKLNQASG